MATAHSIGSWGVSLLICFWGIPDVESAAKSGHSENFCISLFSFENILPLKFYSSLLNALMFNTTIINTLATITKETDLRWKKFP